MKDYTFNDYKKLVEDHIMDFMPEIDHKSITLYEAMKYSVMAGGKRIRPVLLLAACDFCGGTPEEALPYACALEYIHTYSLIHDDLPCMDDDELRRGTPTPHKVYGEATATLAGDGLLSAAFEVMHSDMLYFLDDAEAMKRRICAAYEISKGCGCRGMVSGQIADIEVENQVCSPEMLDYIHLTKTSALIVSAVRAGARLAGADRDTLDDLTTYAENLGLAFQVRDDILDIIGNEDELGKKTGMDDAHGKATYPSVHGLESSMTRLEELTENAIGAIEKYYDNAEVFADLARELAVRGN